jgi:hypothetical protein
MHIFGSCPQFFAYLNLMSVTADGEHKLSAYAASSHIISLAV